MISAWINPYNEKKCGREVSCNDKAYHQQRVSEIKNYSNKNNHRSDKMNEVYKTTVLSNYNHYAHSDGSLTPPPSPSSSSSIVSLNNSFASSSNDNISFYIVSSDLKNNKFNKVTSNKQQQQQQTVSSSSNSQNEQNNNNNDHDDGDKGDILEINDEVKVDEKLNNEEIKLSNDFNYTISTKVDSCSTISSSNEHLNNDNDDYSRCESSLAKAKKSVKCHQQSLQQQQVYQQRLAVLSFEQVNKLNEVMNEHVSIHSRGHFPTLEVRLKDFVTLVREKLELDIQKGGAGMCVKDIRLNGGAASHVLAYEAQSYNDLDLIFAVEFSSNRHYDRVKSAVLSSLCDLLPEGVMRKRITPGSLREAYVGKMVKVNNDGDRWSLISLGNSPGHKNVELKFVDTMRRQFEFSVDSFQIVLDSLLLYYDCAELQISENFYPTVVGESVYGNFHEALYHLQNKLISTRQPEEIRGGGLLKYCNLLVRNYIPVDLQQIKRLERYMCSRFFIDFPDILQQRIKLEAYLRNHFWGAEEESLQYHYLVHLYEVVENSTVCLMGHERRQTLNLIENLAMQINCRERQKIQHYNNTVTRIQSQKLILPTTSQNQNDQRQYSAQNSSHSQKIHQYQDSPHVMQPHLQQLHLPATLHQSSSSSPSSSQSIQNTVVVTQPQTITATTSTATPQQIQLQSTNQPGLLYAPVNGIYYAPVVTICTCGNQNQYLLNT